MSPDTTFWQPRRVVTGLAADGTSRVIESDILPSRRENGASLPGVMCSALADSRFVWACNEVPVELPSTDLMPSPRGGESIAVPCASLQRDGTSEQPPPTGFRVAIERGQPRTETLSHLHDSTDVIFVIQGELDYVVSSHEQTRLGPGDVLVQQGTPHRFAAVRTSKRPPVIGMVSVGSHWTNGPEATGPTSTPAAPGGHDLEPDVGGERSDTTTRTLKDVLAPRRIITGHDKDGGPRLAGVEVPEEVDYARLRLGPPGSRLPAAGFWRIWGIDNLPNQLPTDGVTPPLDPRPDPKDAQEALRQARALPPMTGCIIAVNKIAPSDEPSPMRWHDSADVFVVMHGTLHQVNDAGEEVALTAGDVLIQNGTARTWQNRGSEPVWLGIVAFGAVRRGPSPPTSQLNPV